MARPRSSAERVAALRAKLPPATHKFAGDSYHPREDGSYSVVRQRFGTVRLVRVKKLPAHVRPVLDTGATDDGT